MIVMMTATGIGRPHHRKVEAKMYPEQDASVHADMSKPSGAIVTVAPIAKIVVMDIARRMLMAFTGEKKDVPFTAVKMMIAAIITMTAAQSIRTLVTLLLDFIVAVMRNSFLSLHTLR